MSSGEPVKDYCKRNGISYNTVWCRMRDRGWSADAAVSIVDAKKPEYFVNGVPLQTACRKAGVSQSLVLQRHKLSGEPLVKSFKWYVRRKECLKTLKY